MEQILIIDDDADILDALHFVLEDAGYTVKSTQNGEDAENLIQAKTLPELIILDVLLSGKDGRAICRQLKHVDKTNKIPVIMISAHPAVRQSVLEAGADVFISKPFPITVLLEEVKKILAKKY